MRWIAMSGGVDSAVALHLTRQAFPGEEVLGVTLALGQPGTAGEEADRQNGRDAAAVAALCGVAHRVIPAHWEFRRCVMDAFAREYLAGRTPNPCVVCNRTIKFGLLAELAASEGAQTIVTGHYARLEKRGDTVFLRRAKDEKKDQTYMLAMLRQDQLRRAVFPLGDYTKEEVREIAASLGFVSAHRRDSQDICFIPDGDYVKFLSEYTGMRPEPGDYVDESGAVLGQHKGHWCYTIGQRKGLGISMGRHVFVLSKDGGTNRVTLGDEDGLFRRRVPVSGLNLPSDPAVLDGDVRCECKLRYAHRAAAGIFHRTGADTGILEFDEPQRAPAPGQYAVLYDGDVVLGAGVIEWG